MSENTTEVKKTNLDHIKLTDADKESFFKSFIDDSPYSETLSLFDTKLKVTFRTLTIDENDVVFQQIGFDQKNGIAKNDDSYLVKIVEYRLAGSLVNINGEDFCADITPESNPANKEDGTTYLTERLKTIQKWQTFKLGAITEAFNKFENKVRKLTEESFKENF